MSAIDPSIRDPNLDYEERLRRLSGRVPDIHLYELADPLLGRQVRPFLIAEILICIAELYSGYAEGGSGSVGERILFSLSKLDDIFHGIRDILDRIKQVMDAIENAVKAIDREIHRSAMLDHFNAMNSAYDQIVGLFRQLGKVPDKDNKIGNPIVDECRSQLANQMAALARAINGFALQDGGDFNEAPTLATVISCSSSVGLWARSFVQYQYYYGNSKMDIIDHPTHQRFYDMYFAFFRNTEKILNGDAYELNGRLLLPTGDFTVRFSGGFFERSEVPIRERYPDQPEFKNLFREGGIGIDRWLEWTRPAIFDPGSTLRWERVPENLDANLWYKNAITQAEPLLKRRAMYRPIMEQQVRLLDAFTPVHGEQFTPPSKDTEVWFRFHNGSGDQNFSVVDLIAGDGREVFSGFVSAGDYSPAVTCSRASDGPRWGKISIEGDNPKPIEPLMKEIRYDGDEFLYLP